MGKFDAAIELLRNRSNFIARASAAINVPHAHDQHTSIQSAIAVLRDYEKWEPMIEAAGKVSEETRETMLNDYDDWNFALSEHRELLDEEKEIRALLEALPEPEK